MSQTTPELDPTERRKEFKKQLAAKMAAMGEEDREAYLTERYGEARYPKLVKGHEAPGALSPSFDAKQTGFVSGVDRPPTEKSPKGEIQKMTVDATTGKVGERSDPSERHPGGADVHPAAREKLPLRLNAGWVDMHDPSHGFQPNPSVSVYLWIIRGDGHLILGIEEPGKTIEGFDIDEDREINLLEGEMTDKERLSSPAIQGLGHPTLAAEFKSDGTLDIGKGRIGGELYPLSGAWKINSSSGRYSTNRGDQSEVFKLLHEAAQVFRDLGVNVIRVEQKLSEHKTIAEDSPPVARDS